MRFARFIEKNNKTFFKAVKREIRKQDRAMDDNITAIETMEQDRDKIRERIKDQKDVILVHGTITPQTGYRNESPSIIKNPQEDKGSSRDKRKTGVTKEVMRP